MFERYHAMATHRKVGRMPSDGSLRTVDILIVTILREEYAAVNAVLDGARIVEGPGELPNIYGRRVGTIAREGGGRYTVVLALAGSAGNVNAGLAVARSVEQWNPRYVLLVGIAGGLGGCAVGDVVVSTATYGYEYGKIDSGFEPRPDWIRQVDLGLVNAAQSFMAVHPSWAGDGGSVGGASPKVHFGPVASGDKVMDDPTDPFFEKVRAQWPKLQAVEMESAGAAAAIDELRARGRPVGLLVVRGISDLPRPRAQRATETTAQTGERDAHKARASKVAAQFVAAWIRHGWPVEPQGGADGARPQ